MKKLLALFVAVILLSSIPVSVFASTRAINIVPTLGFTGTRAECEVAVTGNNTSERIEVTMRLMRGGYCEATWKSSGYGYVYLYKEKTVAEYQTYFLEVQVKVNGESLSPVLISAEC